MQKLNRHTVFKTVLLFLFSLFVFNQNLFSQDKNVQNVIRVGWYESACFQEGMSDSSEKSGYAYEYLARISDYTGWNYEYVYGPWSDLFEMLKKGEIDVLAGVSITDERKKYMNFPSYIMGTDNYYLYKHTDNKELNVNNPDSFNGIKLGGIKNDRTTLFLEKWLEDNNLNAKIVYYNGFTERDIAFENKEIDGIAATDNNIKSTVDYMPVVRVGEEPFYLAVTKNRPDVLYEVNSVLNSLIHLSPNYLDALQIKCYGTTLSDSSLLQEEEEWINTHDLLRVGYIREYMPFCGINKKGEVTGIITDVVDTIFQSMNLDNKIKVEYVVYDSFKEMAAGLNKNEIDFSFPVISDRKYLNEMDIAGTFEIISVPFVVAYKGSITGNTFDVIAQYSRPIKQINENYPASRFLQYPTASECMDAIISGEATCTIISSYQLKNIMNDSKYRNIKTMPFAASMEYCIGINKESHELMRILNKGISFINKSSIVDSAYRYIQAGYKYTIADFIRENLSFFIVLVILFFTLIILFFAIFIVSMNRSKLNLQENLEKVNILAALGQEYEAVHVADLDLKTFSTLRLSKGMEKNNYELSTTSYANAVIQMVNQFVMPELREDFLRFLEIEALKKRSEENDTFTYRYAIVKDESGNYIYEMTFVRVSNDINRHLLVIGTKCIDDILKFEREEGQYNAALLSESSFFYEFDVTEGKIDGRFISRKGYSPLFNLKLEFPMTYDDFNRIRSEKLGIQAATPKEAELWTCEGLKKAYSEGKKTVSIRYLSKMLDIYWNGTIILSEDDTSHHLHAVYVCKDVSEYVKAEQENKQELEKALVAAEQANRAKTMFLNNMSHDIRTPMNAILGFTDLIEKEKNIPETISNYIRKIRNSGEYLLTIINNILDMARIESGNTPIEENFMDLSDAENFAVSVFEDLIRKKNQKFIVTNNIQHKYVLLDSAKNQQITMNLLSNAMKYTPEGGTIHMNLDEFPCEKPGCATYRLTISDNGIGMKPEFLDHIFDFFSRERNTTESKIIGTGLGMSIVKKLVDLLGGTIEVESEPNKGSKFTVTFVHKIVENPDEYLNKKQDESVVSNILEGKRVLLVEDNEFNAEIATVILEDFGLQVEHADDGIKCLEMLNNSEDYYYDLILMDIQMPNMDGYQATKKIRESDDDYRKSIPIVAMTANAFEEDKQKAFASGMNGHLAKPIKSEEVKKQLELSLSKKV